MNTININGKDIEIVVERKLIKSMRFKFADDKLFIKAPILTPIPLIIKYVEDHKNSFARYIDRLENRKLQLSNGMTINIIGVPYLIEFSTNKYYGEGKIVLRNDHLKKDFEDFLKIKLKEYCDAKTAFYFNSMYVSSNVPSTSYRNAKTYHGQYTKTKNLITYNIYLALQNPIIIDYVIVHELCHYKYMNHQKEFHNLLERYYPNHRLARKILRKEWKTL